MNVLICVDHSTASRKAVQFAGQMFGRSAPAGLKITLFHAAELLPEYVLSDQPSPGMTPRSLGDAWAEKAQAQGQKLLEETQQQLQSAGLPAGTVQLKLSRMSCLPEAKKVAAALAIIAEISQGNYDIVCLGRRGASQHASSIIGGVSEKVIRECQGKTVWLVD